MSEYQITVEWYQQMLEIVRAHPNDEDLVEQLDDLRDRMEVAWLEEVCGF